MKKNRILMLIASVCLALMLAVPVALGCAAPAPSPSPTPSPSPLPAAKVYEWKFQTIVAPGGAGFERVDMFRDWVEEMTDGRIVLTVYSGGQVVPTEEQFDAVSRGTLEITHAIGSYWKGIHPAFDVEGGLALSFRDPFDVVNFIYDYGFRDYLQNICAEHNIHYLLAHPSAPISMMTKEKFTSVDDFKGLKVRGFGAFLDLLAALGAAPVYIPMPEIYTAAATGTIDAVLTGPDVFLDTKVYEVCPYYLQPNFTGSCSNHVLVNLDAWESLPSDLKHILDLCSWRWIEWHERVWYPMVTEDYINAMIEEGAEKYSLPDEEWEKVVALGVKQWDEWAKTNPKGTEALAMLKDYFREVGYIK